MRYVGWVTASIILSLAGVQIRLFDRPWLDGALTVTWLVTVVAAFNRLRRDEKLWLAQSAAAGVALAALAVINRQPALAGIALTASAAGLGLCRASRATWAGPAMSGVIALALAAAAVLLHFPDRPASSAWLIRLLAVGLPLADLTVNLAMNGLRRLGFAGAPEGIVELVPGAALTVTGAALGLAAVVASRLDAFQSNVLAAAILAAAAGWVLPRVASRLGMVDPWRNFWRRAWRLEPRIGFVAAAWLMTGAFYRQMNRVSFHPDESDWIANSAYLETFAQGDIASPAWHVSEWAVDQPPVARYLAGIGRLAGGYQADDLNSPWDHSLTEAENRDAGAIPAPLLLWWARWPMAGLSVVFGLGMYNLVRQSAGRAVGYTMLGLLLHNPYLLTMLPRAMAEAPLGAFAILAAVACRRALSADRRAAGGAVRPSITRLPPAGWLAAAGVCAGLAGAAKLNGIPAAFAASGLAGLAPFVDHADRRRAAQAAMGLAAAGLTLATATFIFVALNPYTYPDPIGRTAEMFRHRAQQIEMQSAANADVVIRGLGMRIDRVSQRVFYDYASLYLPGAQGLNLALFAIGAIYLAGAAWRWLRGTEVSGAGAALVLFGLALAGPSLLTPLDWDRYYLLPVVFSTAAIAVALGRSLVLAVVRPVG